MTARALCLLVALPLVASCATRPTVPRLARSADLDDRRVAYAREAVRLARTELWPMLDFGAPCVAVFDAKRQRMYGCGKPGASLVQVRPSVEVTGTKIPYDKVRLAWVGRAFVHVPGVAASKAFAKRPWFVIQTREALAGHPAFGAKTTTDEWAAIYLHEYFHIGQLTEPRLAHLFGQELAAKRFRDKGHLEALYRQDKAFQARVKAEHAALRAAATSAGDGVVAKGALCRWLAARRQRIEAHERSFEGDLDRYDALWTYLEGAARYTEARLYLDGRLQPAFGIAGDRQFSGFAATRGKGVAALPAGLLNIGPRYVYALGMHAAFLLDRAAPGWRAMCVSHPRWLIGVVEDLCRD